MMKHRQYGETSSTVKPEQYGAKSVSTVKPAVWWNQHYGGDRYLVYQLVFKCGNLYMGRHGLE